MGWPMYDPEGYDKVLVQAVFLKLEEGNAGHVYEPTITVLEEIQSEAPKAFELLVLWAIARVPEAESDYFTRCVR